MKFLHISDLHLGKSIHGVSLIDQGDQPAFIEDFLALCRETEADAVLIAGDVYDRSSPSAEAVRLLDQLLIGIAELDIPLFLIAGNHDSGSRLSFASELLARENVHICGLLEKKLPCITLENIDGEGPVHIWMMPYLFPTLVAQKLSDDSIRDYDTAVRRLLAEQEINTEERNILIAHQNVTAAGKEVARGGSESMIGGVGQVDYRAFDAFDYVALGHIHSSYCVGRPQVRYAGSPLYYHFDELRQPAKGPLLVEMGAKGEDIRIKTQILPPKHVMREISGSWEEIQAEIEEHVRTEEYLRIVLTDRRINPQISLYLRSLCEQRKSILMELLSDYQEHRLLSHSANSTQMREQAVEELFEDYYRKRKKDASLEQAELSILQKAGELTRHALAHHKSFPDSKDVDRLMEFVLKQEVDS